MKKKMKIVISTLSVLSLLVLLPSVGIGVNKAQAAEISCSGTTLTVNADGQSVTNFGNLTQADIACIESATSAVVTGTVDDITATLQDAVDNSYVGGFSEININNVTVQLTEDGEITEDFVSVFEDLAGDAGVDDGSVTIDAQGHNVTLADDVADLGLITTIKNPGNPSELREALRAAGLDVTVVTPSNGGGSSYSGPTQFTDEIEGQLATAREFTVLNSDLANFQIDVKDLNLVPGEPIEAFVFSTPTYAGVVTPVDGIATFNLANLNLSAGTHTLAVVQPGTNVVKGKATVKVGNTAEAKIAKTAGDSAATGLIAFALILTAAGATAATRRKNNA